MKTKKNFKIIQNESNRINNSENLNQETTEHEKAISKIKATLIDKK